MYNILIFTDKKMIKKFFFIISKGKAAKCLKEVC